MLRLRRLLFFRQMPLKFPAVVKDAENVDDALVVAGTIDDEVPGVPHNSKRRARPFATETQVIRTDACLEVAPIFRSRTLRVGHDIAKGLDDEVFIAQSGVTPELRLSPYENLAKIPASFY